MKSRVDINLTYIFRKIVLVSSMAIPLFITGCKKEEPPVVKSLEQSVVLNNEVEIKYTATLSNVDKAEIKVKREGVLISTEEISDIATTGVDFQKTFSYTLNGTTKGKYEFILTSDNLEKKNSVTIPNFNPSINTGGLSLNLNENSEVNITLPIPLDKNPEDNPISINKATSLDGKTQGMLTSITNGYNLKITALPNETGPYQLELEFGSMNGGLEMTVLLGNIAEDKRIVINPFVQPNDSTLNWYGSGDVNNDNIVNSSDITRLIEIIAGTYSNPSDTRLKDRADVNGDEVVNSEDRQILENKLNGIISYLPGEWNKLPLRVEREEWLKKMLAIDLVSEIHDLPGSSCFIYAMQTMINFHGFRNPTDISILLYMYPFDLINNGRFNLPLYEFNTADYGIDGSILGGHGMNTIILGDNALNWNDLCNIEPQSDQINVQPGQAYLIGINSKIAILGSPIEGCGLNCLNPTTYINYSIRDKIPTLIGPNPDIKIITQR